jgi:hypothetical protein
MPKRTTKMSELVGVRFTPDAIGEIEEWRRLQRVIPSRTDAIRELVREGLESYRRRAAEKDGEKSRGRKN